MLTLKILGSTSNEIPPQYAWTIMLAEPGKNTILASGSDFSEKDALACMHAAMGDILRMCKFK